MKLLLLGDKESSYLWDYYRPGMLSDYDLILSAGDLKADYLSFIVTMARAPSCMSTETMMDPMTDFPQRVVTALRTRSSTIVDLESSDWVAVNSITVDRTSIPNGRWRGASASSIGRSSVPVG